MPKFSKFSLVDILYLLLLLLILTLAILFPYVVIPLAILYVLIDQLPKNKYQLSSTFVVNQIPVANQFMSHEHKKLYLKSPEWKSVRRLVLSRDNHCCKACTSTSSLNIHHITYKRLGDERLSDVVCLCNNCHTKLHDILGYDRETEYPIEVLNETSKRTTSSTRSCLQTKKRKF